MSICTMVSARCSLYANVAVSNSTYRPRAKRLGLGILAREDAEVDGEDCKHHHDLQMFIQGFSEKAGISVCIVVPKSYHHQSPKLRQELLAGLCQSLVWGAVILSRVAIGRQDDQKRCLSN